MLKRMWMKLACRNPAVTIRHQSPFATAGPLRPASWISLLPCWNEPPLPPPASSTTKTTTLIAISA